MFDLLTVCEHDLHAAPLNAEEAREWLTRLQGSPLSYHLDDNPFELACFDGPTAAFLDRIVDQCRALLGECGMWDAYVPQLVSVD